MKPISVFLIAAALGTAAFAQTPPEEHREHHPDAKASSETVQSPKHDMQQQKMKEMQALMEKIEKTKDPSGRAALLAQHAKAMREQMMSMTPMRCGEGMGHMGGGGMMGGGMGHPGADGAGKPAESGPTMMPCHEMMQERMNMMTGMMEQMLRHEEARDPGRK
jgi:hypothetical protein